MIKFATLFLATSILNEIYMENKGVSKEALFLREQDGHGERPKNM